MSTKVTKKKIKLKAPVMNLLKAIGIILVILVIILFFYFSQINSLMDIGYSKKASKFILFNNLKGHVTTLGMNKTLNAAFESEDYNSDYIDHYQNIKYVKQDNFIKNINTLIKKGYSDSNISLILLCGNSKEVTEFSKKDKVRYVEEFLSFPYAKLKNYDRYVEYSDNTGEDDRTTVLIVNLDLDKEAYKDAVNVEKFSTDMLVNKHRKLSEEFVPDDLTTIESKYANGKMQASNAAISAFIEMYNAAESEGYGLVINSAYRSYQDQVDICDTYRKLYGDEYVKNYVAQPGFSEHQTGLAFDIGSTSSNVFANSKEYKWMLENAYKYGFILRFPSKYVDMTGFRTEPWHYRYVGKEIANYIHENDMSYEEYYAINIDK